MLRQSKIVALVTIGLLALGGVTLSQTSRGGANRDEIREVATEYLDLLRGLQDIVSDYSDYLGTDGLDSRNVLGPAIDKFSMGLDEETYVRDNKVLERDLTTVLQSLTAERNRLVKAADTRSQKEARVLRNFSRELQITQELLAEHTMRMEELGIQQSEIASAVDDNLAAGLKKLKESLKALEETKKKTYVFEMPATPKAPVPTIPSVPPTSVAPPATPKMAVPPIGAPAGVRGMPRELNGTIAVTSSSTPIHISNPSGSVEVSGWSEKNISVLLEVEIAASSRTVEKQMIEQIRLRLENTGDRYVVHADFPKLKDPKTRIVNSRMAVNVPSSNKITVENAFGEMELSDLRGGVEASGNVSQIEISNVRGGVSVRNAMGTVMVTDVSGGPIKINNSYGDVTISSAEGLITMQNAFAAVNIEDCHGELRITNSGSVDVSTHDGDVHVENSYGSVSLQDITGNVEVRNAFQSIEAQSISGLARLANQYGSISAEEIGGGLIATNSFGSIDISQIQGRLDLNSANGSLHLNLDGQLSGASSIIANAGSVYLNLADIKDLLLKARIDGGSVSSGEPIDLTSNGDVKTVQLRVGAGRQALTLQGVGSSLIIARE